MSNPMLRGVLLVLATVTSGACFDRSSQVCADGRLCAPGTVCVVSLNLCVEPDRVDACASPAQEGDACTTADIDTGACTAGVCFPIGCGNDIVEDGELCDDGNTRDGDGCSADCLSDESCGNGLVDRNEQCDCGDGGNINPDCNGPNSANAGLCRLDCALHCGDGTVDTDEACDPMAAQQASCLNLAGESYDRGLTECSSTCTPVDDAETCRFVGWRWRDYQFNQLAVDMVATGLGEGFFVTNAAAAVYSDYEPEAGQPVSAPLAAVWAESIERAVAVGAGGLAVHYDAGTWTEVQAATVDLHEVWGSSISDVYAVGDGGTVVHYDGSTWTPMTTPTTQALRGIDGENGTVYAVGDAGTILRLQSGAWQLEASPLAADLEAVTVTTDIAAAVGPNGTVLENRGDGWSVGRVATTANLTDVWGSDEDGVFAVGDFVVLFFDGAVWRPLSVDGDPRAEPDEFLVVGGIAGQELGIVGRNVIMTYEGAAWSPVPVPTAATIESLWGTGPDDVFAVGAGGTILHHDGLSWTPQSSGTTAELTHVWGTATNDVYAVGVDGAFLHYDGSTWTPVASPTTSRLNGVWTDPSGLLVTVGDEGIFVRSEQSWTHVVTSQDPSLAFNAVWGSTSDNLWATRANGRLYHYDGLEWSAINLTTPVSNSIYAVDLSGRGPSDIYAVGFGSLHYSGTFWSPGPFTPPGVPKNPVIEVEYGGVWASESIGVFAVGETGRIERFDGSVTERIRGRTLTDLNDVFIAGNVVFMAGEDGTLQTLVFHR